MGKQNRQRRADKRRKEARRSSGRYQSPGAECSVATVIEAAAILFAEGDVGRYRELVAILASGPPYVEQELASRLVCAKASIRGDGWSAPEVRRVLQKQLSGRHARLGEAADFARWAAEEGVTRSVALASAIEVLSWLQRLPPLPEAAAPRAATGADARQLERIRGLLAKAESTTFPEEADALTAKAQELMTRYAIDQAMVAQAGGGRVPSVRRVWIDDPYAGPKSLLLSEIAGANRCRAVWHKALGVSTVFGFEPDLDAVELLYTSLLVQASPGMKASTSRAFRQSFLVAFASRIGARLREAAEASVAEAAEEHGSSLAPVLLADTAAVDEAARRAFPHMTRRAFSANSDAGWAAGVTAAELANLSTREEIDVLQKLVV